jgi:hypothetical protein
MNEQLQKELLDILRALKDGASPAWQVLVEQRSTYHGVSALLTFLAALLLAAVAVRGARWALRTDDEPGQICGTLLAVASGVCALIAFINGIRDLPTYFAPLGQVLGMVVK